LTLAGPSASGGAGISPFLIQLFALILISLFFPNKKQTKTKKSAPFCHTDATVHPFSLD